MVKYYKKIPKWLFWFPRILTIIFILFLSLFSLDVFEKDYTFWETMLGLFTHNIPSIILLVILFIAWKKEIVGAIAFLFGGLLYVGLILYQLLKNIPYENYMIFWILQISGPAFVISYLYWLNWKIKKAN